MTSTQSSKGKSLPPKLNKFMHPRNPYRSPPSFKKLATKYPDFRSLCTYDLNGKVHLDFKNPEAVSSLTKCLLDQDFDLQVDIPEGRLVPTLPLRLNYILWIEDLLSISFNRDRKDAIVGADIGVGSVCIYPLLGTKNCGWCMLGTEADDVNYTSACSNVNKNYLQDSILVKKVDERVIFKGVLDDDQLLLQLTKNKQNQKRHLEIIKSQRKEDITVESLFSSGLLPKQNPQKEEGGIKEHSDETSAMDIGQECTSPETAVENFRFDFTMCNPPFFSCEEEIYTMQKSKKNRGEPVSAPTGVVQEKVTKGGELEFITQMIQESLIFKDKVRIFSTLIGTKAHIKQIKEVLNRVNPSHSTLTEFCQGRTMRWGLAWTFEPGLKLNTVMSKKQRSENKPLILMMPRSQMTVYSVPAAWSLVSKWLHNLKVKVKIFKKTKYFIGAYVKAFKPTWLHQRRKRRENQQKGLQPSKETKEKEREIVAETHEALSCSDTTETAQEENINQMMPVCKKARTENVVADNEHGENKEKSVTSVEFENLSKNNNSSPLKDESNPVTSQDEHQSNSGGLECILRFNLHLKQTGSLISMESTFLGGSSGKDGLNQLLQYMRNQLANPAQFC